MSNEVTIKDCPFHDESDKLVVENSGDRHKPYVKFGEDAEGFEYYVKCPYCGCRGPHTGTEDSAIEYWNIRY